MTQETKQFQNADGDTADFSYRYSVPLVGGGQGRPDYDPPRPKPLTIGVILGLILIIVGGLLSFIALVICLSARS